MDPLTHTATGIFLGRAGLNRFSPHATWILVLAASAPDVDIVSAVGGQLSYLNFHRHITHSVAAMPVMALLPLLAVRPFCRKRFQWGGTYLISLVAVASHLLLDSTNSYGIRLALPFSAKWYELGITNIVDFWIWAALLLAILGPLLIHLVHSEIGAKSGNGRRAFAVMALLFLLAYNGGRAVLHERAVATLESRVYNGAAPTRVAALPGPANPLRWRGIVETPTEYRIVSWNLAHVFSAAGGKAYAKREFSGAMSAARETQTFRDYLRFAQYPFWRETPVSEPESAVLVQAMDLRFGTPTDPAFVANAIVNAEGRVVRSWFTF